MWNYATINLVNELARLPGVGNVTVMGAGEYSMRIWMDPQKLYSFGLVPEDVIDADQAAEPGGRGRSGRHAAGAEGPAVPVHDRHRVAAERSGPVRRHRRQGPDRPGRPPRPRARTSARIEMGAQTYSQDFKLDGKPAAGIAIYQTPDANSLKVAERGRGQDGGAVAPLPAGAAATASPTTRRSSSRTRSTRSTRRCGRPASWC